VAAFVSVIARPFENAVAISSLLPAIFIKPPSFARDDREEKPVPLTFDLNF
jgi:hypothetical protein